MRTVSGVSQCRAGRGGGALFRQRGLHGAKVRERGVAEETKDHGEAALGEFLRNDDVADDAGGRFKAAFPAGTSGVADQKVFLGHARGHDHDACELLKLGPARSDADEVGGVLGKIALELCLQGGSDGLHLEHGEIGSRWEQLANRFGFARQNDWDRSLKHLR